MIKNKNNRKFAKRPSLSIGDFRVLKRAKLTLSESVYFGHLAVRKVHDKIYSKSKIYKKYSDHPSSHQIHKGTLIAFIVSFTFFTFAQYLFPQIFNFGQGNQAYAAQKNKSWTTNGDFATATNSNLYISGSGAAGNPDSGNTDGITLKTAADYGKCASVAVCPDVTLNQGGSQNFYTLQSVANATVGSNAAAGQKNISVANVTGSFTVGKKVLIAQMAYLDRASYLALPNGGQEEGEIAAVNGSTITLKDNLVNNYYYTFGTSLAQVIEIKEFYNLAITNNTSVGVNAYDATTGKGGILAIKVNNQLSIDAGSQIDLTGQGYPKTKGPGAGSTGHGGAYGGQGGYASGYSANRPQPYGSNTNVSYMGSGGGNANFGGAGGGLVKIASRNIQLNGKIQTNGKAPTSSASVSGAGSGGGVNISSPNITFNTTSGIISAAGGGVAGLDGNDGYGGGGNASGGGPTGGPGDGGFYVFAPAAAGPSGGNASYYNGGGAAGRILVNYASTNGSTMYWGTPTQESDPAISYTGSWSDWASGSFSGGNAKKSSTVGNSISYSYSGKDFKWYGAKTTTSGKAQVTIDGVSEVVDLIAPNADYQCWDPEAGENVMCYGPVDAFNLLIYSKTLSLGTHTVQITNLVDTSTGGHDINIDHFDPYLPNASGIMPLVSSTDKVGPWGYWSYARAYVNTGSLGETGTPLRYTVPTSKGKWKTIDIAGNIPNGTTALFKIRAGSAYGTSDPNGTNGWKNPTNKADTNWSASPTWIPADNVYRLTVDSTLDLTATIEIMMQLNGGDATPRIDSITAYYDSIDDPTNLAITRTNGQSLFKADGTAVTGGASGGFTNETSIRVAADTIACNGCGTSTNDRLQVEVKPISSSFNDSGVIGTDWIEDGGTNDLDGQKNNAVQIGGLTVSPENRYKVRARGIDNEGRSSNWVSYAVDGNGASFAVEQVTPTITGTFAIKSANNNTYVNNAQRLIALSGLIVNDAGNSSPTGTGKIKIQVSQDGKNWGAYDTNTSANVKDNTATNSASYKLITPSASTQADITNAWAVEGSSDGSGDGNKTIFVRAIDNAGNIVGNTQTTTAQFTGTVGGGTSRINDQLVLSNITPVNEQVNNAGLDMPLFTNTYTSASATRARVNWTYYLEDNDSYANLYIPSSGAAVIQKSGSYGSPVGVTTETTSWFAGSSVKGEIYSYGAQNAYVKINWIEFDTGAGLSNTPPNNEYSAIIDRGAASITQFTSLNWSQYLPAGTSIGVQVMASNNADASGGMALTTVTNGQSFVDLAGWQNYRYVKYVFTLHPDAGGTLTPTIYDISLNQSPVTTVTLDSQAPTGSVQINNNNQYTNTSRAAGITLNTTAADGTSGLAYMQFSNNGTNWGVTNNATTSAIVETSVGLCGAPKYWDGSTCWTPYASTYSSWNLVKGAYNGGVADGGSDGDRTVYIKYRDNAGNVAGGTVAVGGGWSSAGQNLQQYSSESWGSYSDAQSYCSALGGRVPTLAEYGLVAAMNDDFYWTSTPAVAGSHYAYFSYDGSNEIRTDSSTSMIKCVRDVIDTSIKDTITLDTTAPTARLDYSPTRAVKAGETLRMTATFTESMIDSPKPKLSISGVNTLTSTDMSKTDATHYYYDYTVGSGNGLGTVSLSVGTDLAGNVVKAVPTANPTFTVDNIAPTITSVTSATANGYYKAGGNIDVAVNFSENVTSTGNVTVNFDSGGSCTFTVSNSATGTCTYTVGSGQNSADLNTSSITGTVIDQATNALTNFTPATSLASSKAIIVDSVAPTFAVSYYTDFVLTQAAGNYLKPGTYYIKVAVTEAIGLAAAPNITINAEGTVNDVASTPTTLVATNVYRYSQVIVQDNAAVGSIAETITTTATDLAGNSGTGTDNSKFTDGKLPVTTVSVAGPNGQNSYYTSYPTITFNVDEVNLQSTQCKWDYQGSFSSCGSSTTPNQDGEHYLTYYSVDNAGNVEDTHTSVHYFFDTAAPNVSNFHVDTPYRVSGTKDAVANNSFVLNITASDVTSGANQMQFSYNGSTWGTTVDGSGNLTTDGSWESIASTKNWTVPNVEGESVLYIKVNDIAGNTFTAPALHIVLDTTNPTDPSLSVFKDNTQQNVASASTWYSSTAPYFSWTSLDGPSGSGIAGYYVYMGLTNSDPVASGVYQDCTGNPNCTVYNQTLANDGAYYFKVVAKDNVGRLSNLISFRYYLDKTPPDVVSNLTGTGMLITDAVRDKIDVSWNAYSIVAGQEAPIDYYEVERVKKSAYDKVTNNFTINGGTWNVPVDNVTNGYGSFKFYRGSTEYNNHAFSDDALNAPQGNIPVVPGVVYVYRIRVKNTSEGLAAGQYQNYGPVYGQTLDTAAPAVSPSGLHVGVCSDIHPANCTSSANKGHEIKVTWDNAASDEGTGIGLYVIYRSEDNNAVDKTPPHWVRVGFVDVREGAQTFEWYDNDTNRPLLLTDYLDKDGVAIKSTATDPVDDNVNYFYRVTAFDKAGNESTFFAKDSENNDLNLKVAPETTPDVTAPPVPTNVRAKATGLDGSDLNEGTGTITSATNNTARDDSKSWETNKLVGYNITISSGTGIGQTRVIASNSADTITVTQNWATNPDSTSAYDIDLGHQAIKVSWLQNPDVSRSGDHAGTGIQSARLYRSDSATGSFVDVTDDQKQPVICHIDTNYCTQIHLPDITTYYYKVKVTDGAGLDSDISAVTNAEKTALSTAPTPPQNVTITALKGDPNVADSKVGKKIHGSFTGSYAKGCLNQTSCIVAYEIYRSETNYSTPEDWIANATRLPDVPVNFVKEERGFLREFDDEGQTYDDPSNKPGLKDGTRYYYIVRARDNTPNNEVTQGPLYSLVSNIDETTPYVSQSNQGGLHRGWDVTPLATKPALSSIGEDGQVHDGLEVKVRDIHPNDSSLRNIVTWRVEIPPTRPQLSYEDCPAVKGNDTVCNVFGKYEVWRRQIDRVSKETILQTKVADITDPQVNYFIDTLGLDLISNEYDYYVRVVDNAKTDFKYPAPYNNLVVNSDENASNFSVDAVSGNSIIPGESHPSVTSKTVTDVGVASAVINWNTDQKTDALVEYKLKDSSDPIVAVGSRETGYNHSIKIFDLKPGKTYSYTIVSRNYLMNEGTAAGEVTTEGFGITPDTSSPTVTTSTVQISWATNRDAKSNFVEWEIDGDPTNKLQRGIAGQLADAGNFDLKKHEVVIKGLRSDTKYKYKIKSISTDGFTAEYPVGANDFLYFTSRHFDQKQFTLAPSSSNVAERNITSTTAQITWQTENLTTSWVDYGTCSRDEDAKCYAYSSGNDELSKQHNVQLVGLVPGTKYFYQVRVKDENDITYTSQEYVFIAVLKPKISNFSITEVKPYEFTVNWETNVETETIVNFGKSAAYGQKVGKSEMTKNHTLTVKDLEDNSEYHFQILAHDASGNEVADTDKIVRTPLDTNGPKIEGVKTDILPMGASDETGSVVISWTTDKPATTLVEYDEGIISGKYSRKSIEDTTLNLSHTVIVKDLKPASSYHYRIVTKDKRGNVTMSQDYTFVTPSKEKSILQLILKSLEETFAWTRNMNKFFGNVGKRISGKSVN